MTEHKPETNGFVWKMEYMRLFTPLFLFTLNIIAGMMITNQGQIMTKLDAIDSKVFHHLTNDELHTPKNMITSKAEFDLYQKMRADQLDEIRDCQIRTEAAIVGLLKEVKRK